jgi:hypothetical protein
VRVRLKLLKHGLELSVLVINHRVHFIITLKKIESRETLNIDSSILDFISGHIHLGDDNIGVAFELLSELVEDRLQSIGVNT